MKRHFFVLRSHWRPVMVRLCIIKRLRVNVLLVVVTLCGILWYTDLLRWHPVIPLQPRAIGFLVNSNSCKIPEYSPWDATVAAVLRAERPFAGCRRNFPVTLRQRGRQLSVTVNPALARCAVECCYQSVLRDAEGRSDNKFTIGERSVCFGEASSLEISDEFVRVRCTCAGSSALLYEDFRAFIVPKTAASTMRETGGEGVDKLNVYMVGLDSVSTLNFRRFLTGTGKLLKEEFDAVPMLGLNKVGVNTFPNILACLGGLRDDQINQSLRSHPYDNIPLVWNHFSNMSYVTLYSEDLPTESTFNFLKEGFHNAPTDYYSRPLYLAIEQSRYVRSQQTLCINQRDHLDFQLQWLEDFIAQPGAAPQFALVFSNSLSHKGPLGYVKSMQPRLNQFLKWYRRSERYNSSVMFLFSDHGMRFGPIMRQELGGYESRLPFFYVILPPWYATRHPDRVANLRANSHRLTTFFDVHATLRDILQDAGMSDSDLPSLHNPAISLFKPVPPERSCSEAGIAPHWCVCRARRPLPPGGAVIWRAASAAVSHISTTLLREVRPLCVDLHLQRVTAAFHTMSDAGGRVKDTSYRRQAFEELVVQLVTTPGGGEFEATVRCWRGVPPLWSHPSEPQHAPLSADDLAVRCRPEHAMTVLDVSRLNLYRGQSDCLTEHFDERRFCYCKDLL